MFIIIFAKGSLKNITIMKSSRPLFGLEIRALWGLRVSSFSAFSARRNQKTSTRRTVSLFYHKNIHTLYSVFRSGLLPWRMLLITMMRNSIFEYTWVTSHGKVLVLSCLKPICILLLPKNRINLPPSFFFPFP